MFGYRMKFVYNATFLWQKIHISYYRVNCKYSENEVEMFTQLTPADPWGFISHSLFDLPGVFLRGYMVLI